MCEQLRKREVDICCLQEVRWRGQRAQFVGIKGSRYKLWWSKNNDGIGGVGILLKEELCKQFVEVQRKSDRWQWCWLLRRTLEVICAYATKVGRSECKKDPFYNDMASEWNLQNPGKVVLGLGDFNKHVGRRIDDFEGVYGGYDIDKSLSGI